MGIQITIRATGLNISAILKDESLPELITLVQANRDDSGRPGGAAANGATAPGLLTGHSNEQAIKEWLRAHGAAELLNRFKWDTYPEKILLLGAWYESRGGETPWRSADMDETFKQAKEKPPNNFPR